MLRFMAFAGGTCYPRGGWDDLVGTFATFDEAKAAIEAHEFDTCSGSPWAQIVDTETGDRWYYEKCRECGDRGGEFFWEQAVQPTEDHCHLPDLHGGWCECDGVERSPERSDVLDSEAECRELGIEP